MSSYRLVHKLGAGAVVETHGGVDGGRLVTARRLIPPWSVDSAGFLERFGPLADGWRSSFSSGLVSLVEVGEANDTAWIVEDFHEGESLRATLSALAQRRVQLKPNEGLTVLMRVLSTLVELHAQGLVHGDVCASTVLLSPNGEVKLTEFGISQAAGTMPTYGPARTERECITPDQLQSVFDTTGDVFRVGLLLFELSVGRTLFSGPDPLALARQYTAPGSLPSVPAPFVALIVKLLGRDPAHRPNSSEAMKALDQLVRTFHFSTTQADVAALFNRAFPDRKPVAPVLVTQPGGQQLLLGAPSSATPPPQPSAPLPSLSVTVSARPPPSPSGPAASPAPGPASPAVLTSRPSPLPAPPPDAPVPPAAATHLPPPASTPSGPAIGTTDAAGSVTFARIATRKMSRVALDAVKAAEAPPPEPPRPAPPDGRDDGPKDANLGDLLVSQDRLSPEQLEEALGYARASGSLLCDALVALELLDEDLVVATASDLTHTPSITIKRLDTMVPGPETLKLVPVEKAVELCVMPLNLKGQSQLMVAMRDPMDEAVIAQLKALTRITSIVGMRASERAIRRTIGRCYEGAPDMELPMWMERGTSPVSSPATADQFAKRSIELRDEEPTLELDLNVARAAARTAPRASPPVTLAAPAAAPGLEEAHVKLLEALLLKQGEPGRVAFELLGMVTAVGRRLELTDGELGRLRFATAAVAIANIVDGRRPTEAPTSVSLAKLLGSAWALVQPLVVPLLEGCTNPVSDPMAAALAATFLLAGLAGGPRPRPGDATAALRTLKARSCFPAVVLDALQRELAAA